jgi:hypothetical protein
LVISGPWGETGGGAEIEAALESMISLHFLEFLSWNLYVVFMGGTNLSTGAASILKCPRTV